MKRLREKRNKLKAKLYTIIIEYKYKRENFLICISLKFHHHHKPNKNSIARQQQTLYSH